MKTFKDKTAVITGAGSGLGRSFALQLYAEGARLALCDVNLSALEETRSLTADDGDRVSIHQVEVSDRSQMDAFAEAALTKHGAVDILINNAGVSMTPMLFDEITDAQFEKVIDINMWGVYNGIRAFLPHLRTRPEANITTISSLAGVVGLYNYSAYSMSKAAVRGLSEVLQCELAGSGVSVLVAHPGGVKTNLMKNAPNMQEEKRETMHSNFTRFAFMDVDKAVSKILRAVKKKKNRAIVGVDANLIWAIRRLFPRSYPRIIKEVFSQATFQESTVNPFRKDRLT